MRDARRTFARYRVRLGFVAAPVALWLATPTPASVFTGSVVAVSGEALRVWAAGHLEKGREVTVTGPYRLMRHPLYVGSTLMGVGFAVAAASVAVAIIVALYLGVTITSAVRSEEAHLTRKFGGEYSAYRSGRAPEAPRRFSWRRVAANREYRALVGLAGALALLAWKAL